MLFAGALRTDVDVMRDEREDGTSARKDVRIRIAGLDHRVPAFLVCGAMEAMMKKKRRTKKAPVLFANIPARSVLVVLLRDVRGTPAEKLVLLDKLKAAGRLSGQDPKEVETCEALLKTLASQSADGPR